jgi:hypothetical protein
MNVNTVLAVLAPLGFLLLIASFEQGLYTLPVLFVVGMVALYAYGWWVRRGERRQR